MQNTILDLHSYLAFAVLIFLLLASLNAFIGLSSKKAFLAKDRQIALIALIFSHVQFILGLILVINRWGDVEGGMGVVMKNSGLRLLLVEHPLVNLIAIVLITIGWSAHKRAAGDTVKFKKIAYLYAIAFILLLSRIPWSQWLS